MRAIVVVQWLQQLACNSDNCVHIVTLRHVIYERFRARECLAPCLFQIKKWYREKQDHAFIYISSIIFFFYDDLFLLRSSFRRTAARCGRSDSNFASIFRPRRKFLSRGGSRRVWRTSREVESDAVENGLKKTTAWPSPVLDRRWRRRRRHDARVPHPRYRCTRSRSSGFNCGREKIGAPTYRGFTRGARETCVRAPCSAPLGAARRDGATDRRRRRNCGIFPLVPRRKPSRRDSSTNDRRISEAEAERDLRFPWCRHVGRTLLSRAFLYRPIIKLKIKTVNSGRLDECEERAKIAAEIFRRILKICIRFFSPIDSE